MSKTWLPITILIAYVIFLPAAEAKMSFFYKEANLMGGYSSRDYWVGKSATLMNSSHFQTSIGNCII